MSAYSSNGAKNLTKHFASTSKEPSSGIIATSVLFISCTILSVIIIHPSTMELTDIGLRMKIACSSLIYKKMLKINQVSSQRTSIGHIINLLSSDVNVFDRYTTTLHYLWIGPLQTLLYTYLMYESVGVSSVFGILFLLSFTPVYLILGKYVSTYCVKVNMQRDQRLKLTNEVINGIKTIKMQTWERLFTRLISDKRKSELKYVQIGLYLKGLLHLQTMFTSVALFITIFVHVIFHDRIDAENFFLLANLYSNIGYSMATVFPRGVIAIREAVVSFKRIEEFLILTEVLNYTKCDTKIVNVALENVTVQSGQNIILKNLELVFPKEKLTVIIGPVGSGKSALLYTILNEACAIQGNVIVNGTISYSSQEPWIFSGTIEENILFGCVKDETRYETVIQVCALDKDFEELPYGDKTLVGEKGALLSGGQKARIGLARAVYKDADTYLLDDPLSAVDVNVGKKFFMNVFNNFLKNKTVVLVTHQLQYLHNVDNIVVLSEGKILPKSQIESDCYINDNNFIIKSKVPNDVAADIKKSSRIDFETRSRGVIAWSVYKYYIARSSYCLIFTTTGFFIFSQMCVSTTSYFVKYWINLEQDRVNIIRTYLLLIYFVLTVVTIILFIFKIFALYKTCTQSSRKLHTTLLNSILQAKIDFFSTNSSGRILNRFSKDINVIDEQLPIAIYVVLQHALSIIGSIILIGTVKPWLIVPALIFGILFYFLNKCYLLSSISLKRLEGITKSPVLEHLIAVFQGLPTVRAFNAQNIVGKMFNEHQDLHSCTYHLILSTTRFFGFWLDIICIGYITIITFTFVISDSEKYGGDVGLLLTQAIQLLGNFQLATKQCAEIENHMTSVERLREYNFIDHEDHNQQVPYPSWPQKGKIQFENVYLKYPSSTSYALKNINFTILPQEKIGIVGRTGSGKSSLVSVLFQLMETEGAITIDDINIKNIQLKSLRTKILIIPQNPLLFSGTIRNNLDVFNEHQDDLLWKALEDVSLKDVFTKLNLDLDSKILEDGCNLSVGQKQLMCLARAILSKRKIVILDEATANVDTETDSIVQKTLKEKFIDCTVLTVAHRLLTVMESDRILVMDNGVVVEFDHPNVLLQNEFGTFRSMVRQTNNTMSKTLIEIAANAYEKLQG